MSFHVCCVDESVVAELELRSILTSQNVMDKHLVAMNKFMKVL
jgi:hypothetical protein